MAKFRRYKQLKASLLRRRALLRKNFALRRRFVRRFGHKFSK